MKWGKYLSAMGRHSDVECQTGGRPGSMYTYIYDDLFAISPRIWAISRLHFVGNVHYLRDLDRIDGDLSGGQSRRYRFGVVGEKRKRARHVP